MIFQRTRSVLTVSAIIELTGPTSKLLTLRRLYYFGCGAVQLMFRNKDPLVKCYLELL
jgi:hypothetical protein